MDPADGEIQRRNPWVQPLNPSSTRSIWVGRCLDLKRTKKKELHPEISCGYLRLLACLKLAYRDIYIYIYIHERCCRCWSREALQLNPTRILHLNPPRFGRKSDCIAMVPTTINDQPKPQAGGMKDPPSPAVSTHWRAKNVPCDSGPRAIPWLFGIQMGLSENRVYSQWNSHLIGIMISKSIGFRGTLFSDTPKCCHGKMTHNQQNIDFFVQRFYEMTKKMPTGNCHGMMIEWLF